MDFRPLKTCADPTYNQHPLYDFFGKPSLIYIYGEAVKYQKYVRKISTKYIKSLKTWKFETCFKISSEEDGVEDKVYGVEIKRRASMVSDPASDKIFEEFILKESPEKKSKKSKSKDKEKESKKTSRKEPDAATKLKVAGVENDLKAKLLKKQQEILLMLTNLFFLSCSYYFPLFYV